MSDHAALASPVADVVLNFIRKGLLPSIAGLHVCDIGCGEGFYSHAFAELGAASVTAIDLKRELMPDDPPYKFFEGDFRGAEKEVSRSDLIFLHLMTEHVYELRSFIDDLIRMMKPGAFLFINHDNYFSPMGHQTRRHIRLFLKV
jgi:2-polyprenyl-3-methyl-5-hydroxy-6-metoxy-1,4-benzoquinol methylase